MSSTPSGWNPVRALDDAVSVVMKKHRDEW